MKSFLLWGFHPTWGQIGLYAMHIVGITKREGSVISSSGGLREPVVPLRQLKLGISLAHLLSRRPFSCSWHAVAQVSIQSAALCYVSSLAFSLLPNFASLLNCQTMPKNCYFSWLIIARCVCVCVLSKRKSGSGASAATWFRVEGCGLRQKLGGPRVMQAALCLHFSVGSLRALCGLSYLTGASHHYTKHSSACGISSICIIFIVLFSVMSEHITCLLSVTWNWCK